jgi:hypothetical protein
MKFFALVEVATAWLAAVGAAHLVATRRRAVALLAVIALAAAVGERTARVTFALPGHGAIAAGEYGVGAILDQTRALGLGPASDGVARPLVLDGIRQPVFRRRLADGVLAIDEVPTLRGSGLPLINRRQQALQSQRLLSPVALARLGVEQVVVSAAQCPATAPKRGFALRARTPSLCLLDVPGPAPRYSLEGRAESFTSEKALVESVFAKTKGDVPVGVLGPLPPLPSPGVRAQGRITVVEERTGRVRLVTEAKTSALLVVRRSWGRGWSARVDGKRADVLPALGPYMALGVSSGRHEVELLYREPGLRLGIAVAIGWLLGWGLLHRRRSRRLRGARGQAVP